MPGHQPEKTCHLVRDLNFPDHLPRAGTNLRTCFAVTSIGRFDWESPYLSFSHTNLATLVEKSLNCSMLCRSLSTFPFPVIEHSCKVEIQSLIIPDFQYYCSLLLIQNVYFREYNLLRFMTNPHHSKGQWNKGANIYLICVMLWLLDYFGTFGLLLKSADVLYIKHGVVLYFLRLVHK